MDTSSVLRGVSCAAGPLVAAGGVVYLLATVDESPDSLRDIFPGMTILALGLAIVVAPLTAVVVADADDHIAGVASGVYHAVVRVAGCSRPPWSAPSRAARSTSAGCG